MTFPGRDMRQGTFTAGTVGSASTIPTTVTVNCGFVPTKVELIDMTTITSMTGTPKVNPGSTYLMYRAVWNQQFASFTTPFTLVEGLTPSAATSSVNPITSNGISTYNGQSASPSQWTLGPQISGSNTNTNGTFTISSTATLYVGATILMTQNSVNKQLGGMQFTVATIPNSTTFTIANPSWLSAGSFTSGAETFYVQLIAVPPLYYPNYTQIVAISQANSAVVTTSVNSNLSIGQQVRLYVPKAFGMTSANFTTAIVSAISGNQVTLGGILSLNSSAFTAFTWPIATGVPYSPAVMVPIGSGPTPTVNYPYVNYNYDVLDDATDNQAFQGFVVGSGILNTASSTVWGVTAGDVIAWTAWGADQ